MVLSVRGARPVNLFVRPLLLGGDLSINNLTKGEAAAMSKLGITVVLVLLTVFSSYAQHRTIDAYAQPEQRVALVIGNSAYRDSPLLNPVNDAKDIARALVEIGYEVIYKENITQNEMKSAIRAFGERIRNGGVGLFYFGGHGVQVNGENYLIPIGATITKEEEIEYESVNVGLVLAQMSNTGSQLNIIILDACRNNPFKSSRSTERGLAVMRAPSGTIIGFATAPGEVASDGSGRNGLYTQYLLETLKIEGLRIEDFFKRVRISVIAKSHGKQVPWEASSLTRDFYFRPLVTKLEEGNKATDPKSVTEEKSRDVRSITGTIWLQDWSNGQGTPHFIEFLPKGLVKLHIGLKTSFAVSTMVWYQTDNILHVISYDHADKRSINYKYEGEIKGNKVEGTMYNSKTDLKSPWTLTKVIK